MESILTIPLGGKDKVYWKNENAESKQGSVQAPYPSNLGIQHAMDCLIVPQHTLQTQILSVEMYPQ